MDILIFILIGVILYPILGMIFGILLTLYKSENLKMKIAVGTFLRPLVFTTILGLIFPSTFNNSLLWLFCFFVIVIVRDIVFIREKYLSKLTVTSDRVSIEYINAFLQAKHLIVSSGGKKEIKLSEMKSISNYPASLTIVEDCNVQRFIIFDKDTWNSANDSLNAANNSFAKAGL